MEKQIRCGCPSHSGDGCENVNCECLQHYGIGCSGFAIYKEKLECTRCDTWMTYPDDDYKPGDTCFYGEHDCGGILQVTEERVNTYKVLKQRLRGEDRVMPSINS